MTEMLPHIVPNFSNIRQFDMDPKHENRSLVDDGKALKIKKRLILALGYPLGYRKTTFKDGSLDSPIK